MIKKIYSLSGYNSSKVEIKTKEISNDQIDILIEVDRGNKTKISSISFVGNKKISNRKLKDITASQEHKFWKIFTKNTNFNDSLLDLDKRLITNYYKSSGFYDAKVNSKVANIDKEGYAQLIYTIEEGNRYTFKKISTNVDKVFDKKTFFSL